MRIKRNKDIEGRRVLLNGEIFGQAKIQGTVRYVARGPELRGEYPVTVELDTGRIVSFKWEEIYVVMADVKSFLGKVIKLETRGKIIDALVVEIKKDPKAIRPIVVTLDFTNYIHITIEEIEEFNEDPEALRKFIELKENIDDHRVFLDDPEDPEED